MEGEVDQSESVNAMFRAVHTIKGSAGLFGLEPIVRFAHTVESVMDRVRGRKIQLDPGLIGLMLECHDQLETLVTSCKDGAEEAPGVPGGQPAAPRAAGALPGVERRCRANPGPGWPPGDQDRRNGSWSECWHISLRFGVDVLRNGMDPLSFVRYLGTLGQIVHLSQPPGQPALRRRLRSGELLPRP